MADSYDVIDVRREDCIDYVTLNRSAVRNAIDKIERGMLERAPLRYQVEALSERLDGLHRNGDRGRTWMVHRELTRPTAIVALVLATSAWKYVVLVRHCTVAIQVATRMNLQRIG